MHEITRQSIFSYNSLLFVIATIAACTLASDLLAQDNKRSLIIQHGRAKEYTPSKGPQGIAVSLVIDPTSIGLDSEYPFEVDVDLRGKLAESFDVEDAAVWQDDGEKTLAHEDSQPFRNQSPPMKATARFLFPSSKLLKQRYCTIYLRPKSDGLEAQKYVELFGKGANEFVVAFVNPNP